MEVIHSKSPPPPPRVVQTIKPSVKAYFQNCCAVALQKIHEDPGDESTWKLLFLFPRMILTPFTRGSKQGKGDAKCVCQKFLNWRWAELVHLSETQTRKVSHGNEEARRAAALRLVRCSELSRASKVLTSNRLAPASADTTKKLASKRPSRSNNVEVHLSPHNTFTSLQQSLLFDIIRKSPRGSGTGLSRWRFEHFRVLFDIDATANGLFSACSAIAKGILPDTAMKLMSSSKLIAIPKTNGDVRPIAIGESLR